MQKIREWAFPVVLAIVWVLASAYTLSLMIAQPQKNVPSAHAPQPAVDEIPTPRS